MSYKIFPKRTQDGAYMPPSAPVERSTQADGPGPDEDEYIDEEQLRDQENAHAEERNKAKIYQRALYELAKADRRYEANLLMFVKWDHARRIWWIKQVEAQAQAGHQTIGVTVVTKVVELRLVGDDTPNTSFGDSNVFPV